MVEGRLGFPIWRGPSQERYRLSAFWWPVQWSRSLEVIASSGESSEPRSGVRFNWHQSGEGRRHIEPQWDIYWHLESAMPFLSSENALRQQHHVNRCSWSMAGPMIINTFTLLALHSTSNWPQIAYSMNALICILVHKWPLVRWIAILTI